MNLQRRGGGRVPPHHQRRGDISRDVEERQRLAVDADIDFGSKDTHVAALLATDMRRDGAYYPDKRARQDKTENDSQSAEHSTQSATYDGNRMVLLKNDPKECKEPGWRPETFTPSELQEDFSGTWGLAYTVRAWLYGKFVEDHMQELTQPLPLGIRLHRVTGAGARGSPGDKLPGFLAKTMLTTYKVTHLELDDKGRIVRLKGVGLDGSLTPAFVWNN